MVQLSWSQDINNAKKYNLRIFQIISILESFSYPNIRYVYG